LESENKQLSIKASDMRAKILQYERGLSKLDNLERLYKDMKLQLETYKAEQIRLKKENTMYEGELQNLRDEIMDMRYKAE
jgi:predicted nuclease with TOPRIM domain